MPELNQLTNQFFDRREAMRPSLWTWLKHISFLLIAFVTVTIAGTMQPFGQIPILPDADPQTSSEIFEFFLLFPTHYFQMIYTTVYQILGNYETLKYGATFSLSFLTILTAHEMGHYVACRIYKVDATLPYFIPLPPLIGPAGTLGAFIKIVSPLPSRRATFDIGVAGPFAGFVAIIPFLVIGLLTMDHGTAEQFADSGLGMSFSDPLLTHLLANFFGVNLSLGYMNPFLAASWLGLLITSLNLIPSGQLDGGHAIYAVFGEKIHFWTGRTAFAVMVGFTFFGWYLYNSPSGLLFAVLLAVMMRVRHPEPLDETPLDFKRKLIAVLTLLMFIFCFVPFPIKIS